MVVLLLLLAVRNPIADAEQDLHNGNIADGVRKLAEIVGREPDDARARGVFILGLLSAGLGDAAREEARRWVASAPGLPAAHGILGFVLMHDAVGRRLGPGFDWTSAEHEL